MLFNQRKEASRSVGLHMLTMRQRSPRFALLTRLCNYFSQVTLPSRTNMTREGPEN